MLQTQLHTKNMNIIDPDQNTKLKNKQLILSPNTPLIYRPNDTTKL